MTLASIADHLFLLQSFPFSLQILGSYEMLLRNKRGEKTPDTKFKVFEVCRLNIGFPGPCINI